jgi:hypothetical protein
MQEAKRGFGAVGNGEDIEPRSLQNLVYNIGRILVLERITAA